MNEGGVGLYWWGEHLGWGFGKCGVRRITSCVAWPSHLTHFVNSFYKQVVSTVYMLGLSGGFTYMWWGTTCKIEFDLVGINAPSSSDTPGFSVLSKSTVVKCLLCAGPAVGSLYYLNSLNSPVSQY